MLCVLSISCVSIDLLLIRFCLIKLYGMNYINLARLKKKYLLSEVNYHIKLLWSMMFIVA